jgi:hypothetical protein
LIFLCKELREIVEKKSKHVKTMLENRLKEGVCAAEDAGARVKT